MQNLLDQDVTLFVDAEGRVFDVLPPVETTLERIRRCQRGIASIEYAMLAVGVALAILAGAQFLGNSINNGLNTIGTDLTADLPNPNP